METIVVFDGGCINILEVIIIGKDKDTRRAIVLQQRRRCGLLRSPIYHCPF